MFEDVDPAAVLERRVSEESGHTEWLVKFADEEEVRLRGRGWGCAAPVELGGGVLGSQARDCLAHCLLLPLLSSSRSRCGLMPST